MSLSRRQFLATVSATGLSGCLSGDELTVEDVSVHADGLEFGNIFESVEVDDIVAGGMASKLVEYAVRVSKEDSVDKIEQYIPSKDERGLTLYATSAYKPSVTFTTGLGTTAVNRLVARDSSGKNLHEITVYVHRK